MCTINDEDGEIELMIEADVNTILDTCRKCRENKSTVVLRGKDQYCQNCFLAYATHKFRASLGKSKLVRKGDKILVAFSGGASSLALLHLIKAGFEEDTHKRLVFEPYILYIDEGAVCDLSVEERKTNFDKISSVMTHFNMPSYKSNIEVLFQYNQEKYFYDLNSDIPFGTNSRLLDLFSKVNCQTSKHDLLVKLRNKLLFKVASDLGCCKILTAESLICTATTLLSNVSLGRGSQLPFDIGFCDNRNKNIKILRPMQDFGKIEIDYYTKVFDLKSIDTSEKIFTSNKNTSIQNLTRQFVNDLQENFPSTLSTIYRTGAKLNIEEVQSVDTCSLCMAPLDTFVSESSSLQATMYSSHISKSGPADALKGERSNHHEDTHSEELEACTNCKCSKSVNNCIKGKEDAMMSLCYGCRIIVKNIESIDNLPQEIVNSIVERNAFQQMKSEIQDFLL